MVWQPHMNYMEAATIVKGLMEELDSELTLESPGLKWLISQVSFYTVAGDQELGGDGEEPLWFLEHDL